jgi:predicted Zn-dependent protease
MRHWPSVLALWAVALISGGAYRHIREPSENERIAQAGRLLAAQQADAAERVLRQAVARRPAAPEPRIELARLAQTREDWATVAVALHPIPADFPAAAAVRIVEGDAWIKLGRAADAEQAWRAALERDTTETARYRLLFLYGTQLRRPEWLATLWDLYDRGHAGLNEMLQIMLAGQIVWEPEGALETVERWSAADERDRPSRRAAAVYFVRAGQLDEAADRLENLFERDPDDLETWSALVDCRLASGELDRADKLLRAAPDAARDNPRYCKQRGRLALAQGRYADAAADLRRGLPGAPYDLELHYNLAQALRLAGQLDASRPHSDVAGRLARIARLCHSIHNAPAYSSGDIRELVQHCAELRLVEEARGWVRVGLDANPRDQALFEARDRLATLPATSVRHPALGRVSGEW